MISFTLSLFCPVFVISGSEVFLCHPNAMKAMLKGLETFFFQHLFYIESAQLSKTLTVDLLSSKEIFLVKTAGPWIIQDIIAPGHKCSFSML